MKKSILYMIKKIIIGVGIILVLGFINSCEVNAATVNVNLPTPSTFGVYQDCGTSSCVEISQWPAQTSALYNGYYTSQWISAPNLSYGYVRYDFGSPSYCDGQNISISGSVQSRNGQNVVTVAKAFLNSTSNVVDCTLNGTYWSCSGKGGGYFSLYFEFSTVVSTDILVSRSASVMCDATLNDVIQQQNQNTSNIINNQNQNTSNIINNQNQNTTIIKDSIDETNDFLKDTSVPNSSDINNVITSATTDNATVSDLVNLIPNTLQVIVNGFNQGCSGGYNLGALFGTELILPCINPVDYLGTFLWGVIDSILCLCYLIPFTKWIVNTYNDLTSLKNRRLT